MNHIKAESRNKLRFKQLIYKSKYQSLKFTFIGKLSDLIKTKKSQVKYLKIDNGNKINWIKMSKKTKNYRQRTANWMLLKSISSKKAGF